MLDVLKSFFDTVVTFFTTLPFLLISFITMLWDLVIAVVSMVTMAIKMIFSLGELLRFLSSTLQIVTVVGGYLPSTLLVLVTLSIGVLVLKTVLSYLL